MRQWNKLCSTPENNLVNTNKVSQMNRFFVFFFRHVGGAVEQLHASFLDHIQALTVTGARGGMEDPSAQNWGFIRGDK